MVGVVAGVQHDRAHLVERAGLVTQAPGQVDDRLCLVLGRVFLGVRVEDRAARLAPLRELDGVVGAGAVQHPGEEAVLALVDRRRRGLSAHRPVDSLDRGLAGEGRGERLPAADLALAGLAGRGRGVHGLLDRLVDGLGRQPQQGTEAARGGGTEVGDVVDAVGVQADALHQGHVDLVPGDDPAEQVGAGASGVLGDREQRRDVVAWVGVVGSEVGVVEVEFTDGGAVRPRGPFRGDTGAAAEEGSAGGRAPMGGGLGAGDGDRTALQRGDGDRGVVDHAVDGHGDAARVEFVGGGGDGGQLPGQLVLAGQRVGAGVDANSVLDHVTPHGGAADAALVRKRAPRRAAAAAGRETPLPMR